MALMIKDLALMFFLNKNTNAMLTSLYHDIGKSPPNIIDPENCRKFSYFYDLDLDLAFMLSRGTVTYNWRSALTRVSKCTWINTCDVQIPKHRSWHLWQSYIFLVKTKPGMIISPNRKVGTKTCLMLLRPNSIYKWDMYYEQAFS